MCWSAGMYRFRSQWRQYGRLLGLLDLGRQRGHGLLDEKPMAAETSCPGAREPLCPRELGCDPRSPRPVWLEQGDRHVPRRTTNRRTPPGDRPTQGPAWRAGVPGPGGRRRSPVPPGPAGSRIAGRRVGAGGGREAIRSPAPAACDVGGCGLGRRRSGGDWVRGRRTCTPRGLPPRVARVGSGFGSPI